MRAYGSYLLLLLLAFFSALMLEITLQYIPIRTDAAFLQIKQEYIDFIPWRIAFFVHVFLILCGREVKAETIYAISVGYVNTAIVGMSDSLNILLQLCN